MPTRLVHYSDVPFYGPVRSVPLDRQKGEHSAPGKPDGLWVSVEGDGSFGWKEWCEGEDWNRQSLKYRSEIVLAASAFILRLTSGSDLDAFTARYNIGGLRKYEQKIDWVSVASGFDGIIIAPYQWVRRLSLFWYYGWDCASGCIWNANAVADVRRLEDGE